MLNIKAIVNSPTFPQQNYETINLPKLPSQNFTLYGM